MEKLLRDKILAITRRGTNRDIASDYFRVALGLMYLDGIMTDEEVDFKRLDRRLNRFIYHTLGKGHSITSILQFMSGRDVLPILTSETFVTAFSQYCNEVPLDKIPALLSVNLAVAKQISGLTLDGPVLEWIDQQNGLRPGKKNTDASAS